MTQSPSPSVDEVAAFTLVDEGKRYDLPAEQFSTLMAHGWLHRLEHGVFELANDAELLNDPGSAGVRYAAPVAVRAILRAVLAASLVSPPKAGTGEPHADDTAVDQFALAMKAKMKWEREERGRYGWADPTVCSATYLADLLVSHLRKGNPGNFEDVANFCMMLHQRGDSPQVLAEAIAKHEARGDGVRVTDAVVWELEAAKRAHFEAFEGDSSGLVTDEERGKANKRLWTAVEATLEAVLPPLGDGRAEIVEAEDGLPCERCQGNGEIVTDWDRYRHPRPGDAGDEAVAECPDCSGTGRSSNPGGGLS